MTRPNDAADLKAQLCQNLESLLAHLLGDGRRAGGWWSAPSPVRPDGKVGTFFVSLRKNPGYWKDFSADKKGDIFQLIAICKGINTFPEVLAWARDYLGIDRLSPEQRRVQAEHARRVAAQRAQGQAQRAAVDDDIKRGRAQAAWIKSRPGLIGTPVDVYLMSRGIDLRLLPRQPAAIRYDPDAFYADGELFPAMRTMMTAPDGKFQALHTTFLAGGGHGKAPVASPKKIRASPTGAAMRLARGASGLDVLTAGEQGVREPLVLAEGIENALSVALAVPALRVWAVGTISNFAAQTLPACCNEVIICADNDDNNPQAQGALRRALLALARHGRPVTVMRSSVGKDANDALRKVQG